MEVHLAGIGFMREFNWDALKLIVRHALSEGSIWIVLETKASSFYSPVFSDNL